MASVFQYLKGILHNREDDDRFLEAIKNGNVEEMSRLINEKPSLFSIKDPDGGPFHTAVKLRQMDSLRFLLSYCRASR
jgi:hypothetical protein